MFVHGSCGGAGQWKNLASRLQDDYRTICVDLLGSGQSETWPIEREWSLDIDERSINAVLDFLNEPVHLIAHSGGCHFSYRTIKGMRDQILSVTYFKRYRMHFDLRGELPIEPEIAGPYEFRPWTPELIPQHADAKFHSFKYELDANVFPCLGQRDGCEGLMREIASRSGFVPEATWLVVLRDRRSGQTANCGTVQGINDQGLTGSIQNLGVVPEHRGHGLARGLLIRALQGFRSIGMDTASLEVTAKNDDAIRLYQRFGFRVIRTVYKSIEIVGV